MGRMMGGKMILHLEISSLFDCFFQVVENDFAPIIRNSTVLPLTKCATGL